ncbi:MAG: RraA family protein [Bacillota bacterium]|nr:RraA family protein [Bacillota bacterium]
MSNKGFRVFCNINRPDSKLVDSFKDLPVANVADCMNRFYVMKGLKPYNETPLIGTAVTVKARIADNLMFHKALDIAKPGDVIVVDAGGDTINAVTGEIMMRSAISRGIKGFVIDGAIRDVDGARKFTNFSVYAKGVTPMGPFKDGPGEVNVTISCGGTVVNPGDIIIGDADGVLVIPPSEAAEIQKKAKEKFESEVEKFKAIDNGTEDKSWVDEKLKEKGCEFIE